MKPAFHSMIIFDFGFDFDLTSLLNTQSFTIKPNMYSGRVQEPDHNNPVYS